MPGKRLGICAQARAEGGGFSVFTVGWAAGFLDTGLTQRDHSDFLQQHPLPEQTQQGGLEKRECDN